MTIEKLNNFPLKKIRFELGRCCGSSRWITEMVNSMPMASYNQLIQKAQECWANCSEEDWLEAFSHHPKIGEKELEKKFASTANFAVNEQSAVKEASKKVISQLAGFNEEYLQKFGFIFIIFATGKSASEMLKEIEIRIKNNREEELKIAASEQLKITRVRIKNLFEK